MSSQFKKLDNKGILFDAVTLLVSVFAVIVTLAIGLVVFNAFTDAWSGSGLDNGTYANATNNTFTKMGAGFHTFDAMFFPLAVLGLIIGLIITSFLIPSHPVFLVVNIIGIGFIILLGVVFRAIYEEMASIDYLNTSFASLPYSTAVVTYLPIMGAVVVIIATIVGYSKRTEL